MTDQNEKNKQSFLPKVFFYITVHSRRLWPALSTSVMVNDHTFQTWISRIGSIHWFIMK